MSYDEMNSFTHDLYYDLIELFVIMDGHRPLVSKVRHIENRKALIPD